MLQATASEDREEVSDTSMTSRLYLLLDQSKISNPVSDTFMKEVQLFAAWKKRLLLSPNYISLTILPASVETEPSRNQQGGGGTN